MFCDLTVSYSIIVVSGPSYRDSLIAVGVCSGVVEDGNGGFDGDEADQAKWTTLKLP